MGQEVELAVKELEKYVEGEDGPVGLALTWAKDSTGQSKVHIYLYAFFLLLLAVGTSDHFTAATITLLATTPYPVIQSLRLAEVGTGVEQGTWLLYWCAHALVAGIPVPFLRLLACLWLQHPLTAGAALLYRAFARPFILLQHRQVHMGAFADLHPSVFTLAGLSPSKVQPFLAAGTPERLEPKLLVAGSELGLQGQLRVTHKDPPTTHTPSVSLFTHPNQYSAIASAALSGIRNAAATA